MPARASAAQAGGAHWVASWSAAPQSVSDHPDAPGFDRAPAVDHQTVRQIVYSRLSGNRIRIHVSNRYGRAPLSLTQARVALALTQGGTEPGSDRTLTFSGHEGLVLAPGAQALSDPIALPVTAGAAVAVSFYLDGAQRPWTWHKLASQVNYLSAPGNHAGDVSGAAFRARFTSYLWLDGLDVDASAAPRSYAVVAIGDSITDGMRSSPNANRRWPDVLARALAGKDVAVVNQGISGNRLLSDSPCYGERLVGRFDADALAQAGARSVLVLIGINDINFAAMAPHAGLDCDFPHTRVSSEDLIQGYRSLIAAAHAHHMRIVGATITPASLPPAREAIRLAVNQWIRSGGAFDDVVDFDAVLRNPAKTDQLLPRYDSDDHIHPNDAGYAAMASQVTLERIAPR